MLSNGDELMKSDFLECYKKARESALTSRNIRSGWRQTGLWPVNINIPLSNPRLLQKPKNEPRPVTPSKEQHHDTFKTPAAGAEVRALIDQLQREQFVQARCEQLAFQKVQKALDTKNTEIADLLRKNASLQQLNKRLQPKRRAKVVPNQNQLWVQIPDIIKAKEKLAQQQRSQLPSDAINIAGFDKIFD